MEPIECIESYSVWDKKIRNYLMFDLLLSHGIEFAKNNPLVDTKSLKGAKGEKVIKDLISNLGRSEFDSRKPRKLYLADLYAICKTTNNTPDYFLLGNIQEDQSRELFDAYLIKDRKSLIEFMCQNEVFGRFLDLYCSPEPLKIPIIKLPEDPLFLSFFQAKLLSFLPRTFQQQKQNINKQEKAAREKEDVPKISYTFALETSDDEYDLFKNILDAMAFDKEQVNILLDYNLIVRKYMRHSWSSDDQLKLVDYERWTKSQRFLRSVNAFLLVCVLATVVAVAEYRSFDLNKDIVKISIDYVNNNEDVQNLITDLLVGSFLFLNENTIITPYELLAGTPYIRPDFAAPDYSDRYADRESHTKGKSSRSVDERLSNAQPNHSDKINDGHTPRNNAF